MSIKCRLCKGTGENRTGITMQVNDDICPRCGGYGTVPEGCSNQKKINDSDRGYIRNNGGEPE